MFAILLNKGLDPFYQNISSFPTAIYSVLLIVCMLYWAVAMLGFVDLDILEIDGIDAEGIDVNDPTGVQSGAAGMLMKFGLNGVPITIIVTLVVMIGWLTCYYIMHYFVQITPDWTWLRFGFGLVVLLVTVIFSALLTAQIIKPVRKFFVDADLEEETKIIGQKAVVRSSRVDKEFGEVVLADGGAGLLLKVRATGGDVFARGDTVIVFEYLAENNIYRVISEQEFRG